MNEEPDHIRRPPALEGRNDIYALTVVGESMRPRYDPGDPVYVDPKAQPRIGDDVVVYLRRPEGEGERIFSVLVKQLARRTSSFIELTQYRPETTFVVPIGEIAKIDRIIPWRELTMF
jgi:phage repressor protein C with HTH and peptisase S24 domain